MTAGFQESIAPVPKSGHIEVLSWRTYPSLVSALREVVSNASDADANNLNVTLSQGYDTETNKLVWKLTFFDDGEGMNLEDFENYLRLSGIGRRTRTGRDSTSSGRKIIGMLGIGSLAVASWADRVEVVTKKKDSNQVLHAKIPYGKFFNNADIRNADLYGENGEYRYQHRTFDLQNADAFEVSNGFTIIDLVGLTEEALHEILGDEPTAEATWDGADLGLLGEGYSKYMGYALRNQRNAFKQFPPMLRLMHKLALLIPVPYPPNTPIRQPPIRTIVNELNAQCMDAVTFQGVKLQRPMIILDQQTQEDRRMIHGREIQSIPTPTPAPRGVFLLIDEALLKSNVRIRGYIWGQNKQIKFEDLAGIQLRIKNVGIGWYNFSLFDTAEEENSANVSRASRRQAISGEILIDYSPELDKALRGDREGFQESSPVYRELKSAVYKHIKQIYRQIDQITESQPRTRRSTPNPTAKTSTAGNTATDKGTTGNPNAQGDTQSLRDGNTAQGTASSAGANSGDTDSQISTAMSTDPIAQARVVTSEAGAPSPGMNATAVASDGMSANCPEIFNGMKQASTVPTSAEEEATASHLVKRIFRVGAVETEHAFSDPIESVQLRGEEVIVSIRSNALPLDASQNLIDRISSVAAAVLVSQKARERGDQLTEAQAVMHLEEVIEAIPNVE